MREVTEKIKQELLARCEKSKQKDGYDFWNEHIKYVVDNAGKLAKEYGADIEIVELGALLHDIAMPSEYGDREEHHIYGAEIAEELLTKLDYPKDRIEKVKNCVLKCVADADVIAHFDCIPSLFSLVYNKMNLSISDGAEYVKRKLERDYNKLSPRTKEKLKERYDKIMEVLFLSE